MGGPLGDASKGNLMFRCYAVHLLPCIKERRLFGQYHGILKSGGFWNGTGLGIGLQIEIGVFEFEAIREGEKIPALVKEGPEVSTVAPSQIVKNGLVYLEWHLLFLQEQGEILMKQEAGKVCIFGLQIKLIVFPPILKQGKPCRTNSDVYVLVKMFLFSLNISIRFILIGEALRYFSDISELIKGIRNVFLKELNKAVLLGHIYVMNAAVFQELLHDASFQDITNQNQWAIIRKGALGFQVIEEFL